MNTPWRSLRINEQSQTQRGDMRALCIFMSSAFKENFKFCPQGFDNGYAMRSLLGYMLMRWLAPRIESTITHTDYADGAQSFADDTHPHTSRAKHVFIFFPY